MKNIRWSPVCAVAIALLSLPAPSSAQDDTESPRALGSVTFEGGEWLTREYLLRGAGLKIGSPWTAVDLDSARERLSRNLYIELVSGARVTISADGKSVDLVFDIKPRRIVRRVDIEGNDVLGKDALRKAVNLTVGTPFIRAFTQLDRNAILALYHQDGFLLADVRPIVQTTPRGGVEVLYLIAEGHRVTIQKIEFKGRRSLSEKILLEAIGIRPERGFGILSKGYMAPSSVDMALQRLDALYQENGFFKVKVGLDDSFLDERKRKLTIRFLIDEGPRFLLKGIDIQGRQFIPEETLRRELDLTTNVPFSSQTVYRAGERMRQWYLDHTERLPGITISIHRDMEVDEVSVTFKIVEGDPMFVGEVRILGNTKTRDRVLRRNVLMNPGEIFDPRKLGKSQSLLEATGIYESALVSETPRGDGSQIVDVDVHIAETDDTGYIEVGGGASDGSGAVAYVNIESNNFDLFRWPRSWNDWKGAFTGGGQKLQVQFIPGTRESEYSVLFREPYFFSTATAFTTTGSSQIYVRESYDETRFRVESELRRFFDAGQHVSAAISWRAENVIIDDFNIFTPPDVLDAAGSTFLSYPRLSLRYDKVYANRYSGYEGFRSELRFDAANSITGSSLDFLRAAVEADYYATFFDEVADLRHALQIGFRAGWVEGSGSGSVPIFERFYLGGPRDFRGFEYRRVGPRQFDTPVGGQLLVNGTVQYSFPLLLRELRGVALFDWGNLETLASDFSARRFRTSAGVGLQFRSPMPFTKQVVPINLYWTRALAREPGDVEQLFTFWLGLGF